MVKKICFCTTTSITLKTFVIPTAKMLHETENFDIYFICSNDETFKDLLPGYIKYISIEMKRGIDLSAIKAVFLFYKTFKKYKFDIVQYSTPNASLYASIAAKLAHIPTRLYAQWGIRYVGFNGKKRKIFKFLEKAVCKKSTNIRAVSNMNLDFAVNEGLYKRDKVKIIGEGGTIGVSFDEFHFEKKEKFAKEIRNKYNLDNDFIFGFVGRFSKDKGSDELLACIKKLDNENIKLLCVGPEENNSDINQALMNWAKFSNKVIFTGFVSHDDLEKYYAAMNCYVHPTYREGFGMVLQEAGAMGCPIITTDIPGASEVMINNESCLLAQPKSVNSLLDTMNKVIQDEELRINLGNNARSRTKEKFERKVMLNNQLEDYLSLEGK